MKHVFDRNSITVHSIYNDFNNGRLYADHSYQRRRVWNDQDKVRLIETILVGLVMPEVYFWTAERDPDTGEASTHIVDGQQRITSIVDYISGEFCLNTKYLLNDSIKETCGNKFFKDLSEDYKRIIWGYNVAVVQIDSDCNESEIRELFYRLNLTNYSLNPQEKRNSKPSIFGDKSEALSRLEFWDKVKLFSASDVKRMKDVEYCCSIYILANEGIVDQTNGTKINNYYDDYSDEFDKDDELKNKVLEAISIIEDLVDKSTLSFISKKAQMYTLFSVLFKLIEVGGVDSTLFERFKTFVVTYSLFRNEFDLEYKDPIQAQAYEDIKKYKLASSEGVNKILNRTIRYEILYKVCTMANAAYFDGLRKIADDMQNIINELKCKKDALEEDDLIDEEYEEITS